MKDKFKAMVERAIENGWLGIKNKKISYFDIHDDEPYIIIEITTYGKVSGVVFSEFGEAHLSDLLFNHEFMRALVGNGCTNFKDVICTEDRVCTFSESCETCEYYSPINAMLEAAQLPTDQQRIDYMHGLIKGESE